MFTIAVVTGTRAEYGLLRPVLFQLQKAPEVRLQLLVTGTHLAPAFGMTVNEIEKDGFAIAAKLDILSASVPAGRAGTAQRTALALRLFTEQFSKPEMRPDAVVLLGDRYEIFAAGQAAALLDIPLVHISGGDVTTGADDDWFRHCLTKMAKLHFPSCRVYAERLLRMGEAPDTVFNVGALGDENIRKMELLSFEALRESVNFALQQPYALITLHPETLSCHTPRQQVEMLLQALAQFPSLFCLFTGANADAGGEEINRLIETYCAQRGNAAMVSSLGVLRYLSAMKYAAVVVGNSSSGVVETPSFGVPTVDIGQRQQGRLRCDNVLHCDFDAKAIQTALQTALSAGFSARARAAKSPYNGGNTSENMVHILLEKLRSGALQQPKVFYDGEEQP